MTSLNFNNLGPSNVYKYFMIMIVLMVIVSNPPPRNQMVQIYLLFLVIIIVIIIIIIIIIVTIVIPLPNEKEGALLVNSKIMIRIHCSNITIDDNTSSILNCILPLVTLQ